MGRRPNLAAFSCLAILVAAEASADDLTFEIPDADGATFMFYGQFDPALQYVDDGFESYSTFVDSSTSTSRFGFRIETRSGNSDVLFNFESSFGFRPSDGVSQDDVPPAIDWDRGDLRKFELVASGDAGVLHLGQGAMATDGVAEFDESGATLISKSAAKDFAGDFQFRDAGGALSGISIGDVFTNLDGSRRFRARYDTPEVNGFVLRAAAGVDVLNEDDDSDYYDAALVYSNSFGEVEVQGGVGYSVRTTPGRADRDQVMGSVTAVWPGGLNLTLATGTQLTGNEGDYVYGKVGYIAKLFDAGTTRFAIDYNLANDFDSVGSTGTAMGIGVVQQFADQKVEAYIGYQSYAFEDASGATYADLSSLLVGARWRF